MNSKWLFGIGIAVAVIFSVYFVIQLNLNMAILSMVGLFALTNGLRAKTFHDQGHMRESKWMRWAAFFFCFIFVVLIVVYAII